MNQTFRSFPIPSRLLAVAASVLTTAAIAAQEPQRVAVRIEIAGQAFAGQLEAKPTMTPQPSTQPATQPADVDPPIVITGGDAPFAIHLDAGDSIDPTALRDTRVHWDFGDQAGSNAGKYNAIDGFNAAHVYDDPGTYTITRTIESPAGRATVRIALEVKPAARKAIYVSAAGNDASDGTTPERALRSWSRAIAAIGPNVEFRFRRGDTFALDRILVLRADNVRFTSYGDPAMPKPMLTIGKQLESPFTFETVGKRTMIDGLAFDATYSTTFDKANLPDLFHPIGNGGLVIRGCTFLNLNTIVNGNGAPTGVMIVDNELPLETGLRSYLAWIEGSNWTVLGNTAANSTREHIIRVGGGERINLQFNDFTNLDRRAATTRPDPSDTAKAALNIQKGRVIYAAHNTLRGANGVGPLGKTDGLKDKDARWVGAVIDSNRIDGMFEVNHGASHITLRNNLIRTDDNVAMPVAGFDQQYGRGVVDLTIEHNTTLNAGTIGNFIQLQPGAKNVRLLNNLYVAPNLVPGGYLSAAVYVSEPDLRAFSTIAGNCWPTAKPNGWAQGGINYVAAQWGEQSGYRNPAEWNGMKPVVEGDRFETVSDLSTMRHGEAGIGGTGSPGAASERGTGDSNP